MPNAQPTGADDSSKPAAIGKEQDQPTVVTDPNKPPPQDKEQPETHSNLDQAKKDLNKEFAETAVMDPKLIDTPASAETQPKDTNGNDPFVTPTESSKEEPPLQLHNGKGMPRPRRDLVRRHLMRCH